MNYAEILVRFGTLILVGFLLIVNLMIHLFSKKSVMEIFARASLEEFFSCIQCVIRDKNDFEKIDEKEHPLTLNSERKFENENPLKYVHTKCDNIYIDINNRRLKFIYYMYFNLMAVCLGYFTIQTVFLQERISPQCLKGYDCRAENSDMNCSSVANNATEQSVFFCYKYTIESTNVVMENLAEASALFLLISKINGYLFNLSFKFSTLKFVRRFRIRFFDPSKFFIPHVILALLFWLILPYFELTNLRTDLFSSGSYLRKTKFQAIYTISIATLAIAGQTAFSISDLSKNQYLVYERI
jgi:hypothetical protein